MFKVLSTVVMAGMLFAFAVNAQTTSGDITADQTWSGTVTLTGSVIVRAGTLTIQPGTTVKFTAGSNATVAPTAEAWGDDATHIILGAYADGAIVANGNTANHILFTSAAATKTPGDWGAIKIRLLNRRSATSFTWCDFEYGWNGPNLGDGDSDPLTAPIVTLDNCVVRNMDKSGIYASGSSSINITHCKVFNCAGNAGIFLAGNETVTIFRTMVYHVGCGILLTGAGDMTFKHITVTDINSANCTAPTYWTGWGMTVQAEGSWPM
jgi:hypothetical protein